MLKLLLKILLVFILLAVIAGVSYVKLIRADKRQANILEGLKKEYFETQDSIYAAQLDEEVRQYLDSIRQLDQYFSNQIDSLNEFYSGRESVLTGQLKQAKEQNNRKMTSSNRKMTLKKDSLADKVKAEYKSALGQLPADLTSYEKRVAYNEIKIELSEKYEISPDSLQKLIK